MGVAPATGGGVGAEGEGVASCVSGKFLMRRGLITAFGSLPTGRKATPGTRKDPGGGVATPKSFDQVVESDVSRASKVPDAVPERGDDVNVYPTKLRLMTSDV